MNISVSVRRAIAGFSVAAILLSFVVVSTANAAFKDVGSGDWFYSYVSQLVEDGIVSSGDYFRPGDTLNRAEMAKLAVLAAGLADKDLVSPATASFSDVSSTAWFYKYVETAKTHGFVAGDPSGKYRPTDWVKRAEAAKILVNALELKENTAGGPHFSDVAETDWFYGVVETAYNWSALDGYSGGLFMPAKNVNRGEIAKMIVLSQSPVARVVEAPGETPPGETPPGETPPTGGELTVALSGASPAPTNLPSGSSYNTVAAFDFTAPAGTDVVLKGLAVTKGGYLANASITGVSIYDSTNKRHGQVASSLTADAQAVILFPDDPITVKGGTTESVVVKANILSTVTSGTVYFGIAKAADITSTGTAVGTFPINGATFGLVSGAASLGAANIDVQAISGESATAQLNVDENNAQELTKFSIVENSTGGNEAIKLYGLNLYNYGNASASDYKDVELVAQDGTILTTVQPVGQIVSFDLSASPYTIDKGLTKYFTVRAKVIGGTTKTIQLVVYNDYDVMLKGASTLAYLLPIATGNAVDATFPVGNGAGDYNKVKIGQGTLSFNKDSASPSTSFTPSASGVVLAKFYAKPTGENMELRKVEMAITKVTTALTGNVTIKVNDSTVYSAAASGISAVSGTPTAITLSTYPILQAGINNYITVEGSVSSSAVGTDAYKAYLDLTEVKLLTSNLLQNPTVNQASGNLMSVTAAALKVTTLSTPVAGSYVASSTNITLAKFELNASTSGEDVKVSKIIVTDSDAGTNDTDFMNFVLYDATGEALTTTTSSSTADATSGDVTFNLAKPVLVTKTAPVTLTLKADISAGAGANSHTFNVSAAADVTATGAVTGNSVATASISVGGAGQARTVTSVGMLGVSLVSGTNASPSQNQLITAGTAGGAYFAFKLSALYEPIKITSLKLTATGAALKATDVANLALYRGTDTTAFATAPQFSDCITIANTCTYTWTATDNLLPAPVDPASPVTIYVKADIGNTGSANLGNNFYMYFKDDAAGGADEDDAFNAKGAYTGLNLEDPDGNGVADTYTNITGGAQATGTTFISPFSVVAEANYPISDVNQISVSKIATFKITNNGQTQITLTKATFADNATHPGGALTYKLYASSEDTTNWLGTLLETTATGADGITDTDTVAFGTGLVVQSDDSALTISSGRYRYLTVVVVGTPVNGDKFNLAISALGDLQYSVAEGDLGYNGNPGTDPNTTGTILNLYVDGKPVLATVTKTAS